MHTIIGVIFVITLSLGISNIAEAQPPSTDPGVNPPVSGDPPATPSNATPGEEDDISTCQIEYLGWILCPVINTAAKVGDEAFGFLARNFLETQPELVATDSGTRDAWELARNMANILFIAAFLIIILSQVTGRGIDNYLVRTTPIEIEVNIGIRHHRAICNIGDCCVEN